MNQISTGSFHLQKFQILPNKTNSVLLIPGKQEYLNFRKFININDDSDKAKKKTPQKTKKTPRSFYQPWIFNFS